MNLLSVGHLQKSDVESQEQMSAVCSDSYQVNVSLTRVFVTLTESSPSHWVKVRDQSQRR